MTNLLLYHVSDRLYDVLEPPDSKRPLFYWYGDRLFDYYGQSKYVHLCMINPKKQNIALRSRTNTQDFDGLHRDFLAYLDFLNGRTDLKYAETGIAMSFDPIKPTVVLKATGKGKYKFVRPKRFLANSFTVLDDQEKPIPFIQIPELAEYVHDTLPIRKILPDSNGKYSYGDWLPMVTEKDGVWL